MSQNVMNNWFQKLGTDSNFLDRQSNTKSVVKSESTFQSFLSQQIKKSSPGSTDIKSDTMVTPIKENKSLKRMDTTASKLAVKVPDKGAVSSSTEKVESKPENDNKVLKVKESTDNVKESNVSKSEGKDDVKQIDKTKDAKDTKEIIDLSEVAPELLQLIQSLPEEVVQQLPEELQSLLADISQELQSIANQTTGKNEGLNVTKLGSEQAGDLNSQVVEKPLVDAEIVNTLKQMIGQLKGSENINKEQAQSFEGVLEQFKNQLAQSEVVKPTANSEGISENKLNPTNTETVTTAPIAAGNTNNASNGSGEGNTNLSSNTQNPNLVADAKSVKDVKVEVQTDGKTETDTTVHNFSARAEASTIAFGKQEVTNQTVKNTLHTNIMDQIINSPKLQIKQTEQGATMTLKLNPEVLGNVEIKMEIVKGVLQAEINVENMIVKGAIESSLADLKNALSDKGYQVETLNVSVGQEGRQAPQQQQQERHSNERAAVFTPEELEAINSSYDFDAVVNDTRINYLG